MKILLLALALVTACGTERTEVHADLASEVDHRALSEAVDRFVEAHRTPEAFAELARAVAQLRPAIADEAELTLMTLALAPVQAEHARPVDEQLDALALTVVPALLAPPIGASDLAPKRGEDRDRYLQRLCTGPLADSCDRVAPESQGRAVYALAIQRAASRARRAVERCLRCGSDQGWHIAALGWEELERGAAQWSRDVVTVPVLVPVRRVRAPAQVGRASSGGTTRSNGRAVARA